MGFAGLRVGSVLLSTHNPRYPITTPRRGYRDVMHRAALNEAAAAGVLALAGWPQLLDSAGDGDGGLGV